MTAYCKKLMLSKPLMLKVQALDPKSSTATTAEAAIMLPHLLFSDLGREYQEQFHKLFATDALEWFWSGVEKTPDDRVIEHPIAPDRRVQHKNRTIPVFLHGDGVEFQTRDSLMCWSFGGFLNKKASLDCHLHISCWPKSCTHKTTWDPLYKWIKWSFEALLKGKHPEKQKGLKWKLSKASHWCLATTGQFCGAPRAMQTSTPMY